jgi:DNA-binding beta-propeller fold protein YncE
VADNNNHRVQQFDAGSLAFQRTWGAFGTDPGELGFPRSLAALAGDPAGGVFVGDTSSDRVQAFDAAGARTGGWGTSGRVPGGFTHPAGVSVDGEGRIFVADTFNSRIQRLSAAGAAEATWGKLSSLGYPTTGSGNGEFRQPEGVAVDGARRLVFVADTDNHRVQALDADTGAWRATWGGTNAGTGAGQFRLPRAVALDAQGSVYVADTGNDRIQRFDLATSIWTVLPVAVSDPKGIAVDWDGKVYVADTANNRVLVLTPQGETVATIAGGLLAPRGVVVDREGRVLVADAGNDRLVRFNPGDGGYVFDGAYGEAGSEPGQFAGLGALVLDASGNAFTADRLNNRLQRLIASGARTEPPPVAAAPPAPAAGAAPATRAARAPDGRRLILTARRRSRTKVRLSGALLPAAGSRLRSPCAGTVALTVRRSGRTIARRRARLRRACTYAALVRVRAGRRRTTARATLEGLRVTVAVPNRVRRR